jgi:MYXO-CTERM domain-containing protein
MFEHRPPLMPAIAAVSIALLAAPAAHGWRSSLYPEDWQPGLTDGAGRFLHDFSYAGYHRGEDPIPDDPPGPVLDVTRPPYSADPTGGADATAAIQAAIDDAGAAGGGIVFLPAGTYRVAPPPGAAAALHIGASGVVLRGAGSSQTYLVNDETQMRDRRIINVRPDRDAHFTWYATGPDVRPLSADLLAPTVEIPVADTAGYQAGDWIVIRADPTAAFIADHGMAGTWDPAQIGGPIFYRRIEAVDAGAGQLVVDVPTRYPLLVRDNARVHRIAPHLAEIGIEGLSVGNRQNTTAGTGDEDYLVEGTGAFEMHASFAIYLNHVADSWVRDVATFRPAGNAADVHVLSNGLRLDATRFVTVTDCDFRRPQYLGEGGNGNLIVITGSENLIAATHAERGRHNYSFGLMYVSGNVIHRSSAADSRLPSDFHMQLSMANLIDNMSLDGDSFEAVRRECCGHGHSTTESVFWNTSGIRYPDDQLIFRFIVESAQLGHGYVIGTRGPASDVRLAGGGEVAPADLAEGIGEGAELEPESLYEDQRARRLGINPGDPGSDAGPSGSDAGPGDNPGAPGSPAGCGCSSAGGGSGGAWLALLVGILFWRLSRRAGTRSRTA